MGGSADQPTIKHAGKLTKEKYYSVASTLHKNGANWLSLRPPAFAYFFDGLRRARASTGANSSPVMRMATPVTRPTTSTSPG
jgi:hypothetical protein